MLGSKHRGKFSFLINPVAGKLASVGVPPTTVSLFSIVLAVVAFYFLIERNFLPAGIMVLLTGYMDGLDGAVARITNNSTKLGSYTDAISDRYVEGILLFGVGFATGQWLLVFIVLFGAFLTPYSKARTALEIPIKNNEWPDLIERGERMTILSAGLILFGLFTGKFYGFTLIWWFLLALAALTNLTAVQRINRAKNLLKKG